MIRYKIPLLVLSIFILCSCSDDKENGPSYSFEDQVLQGVINGQNFSFGDGFVDDDSFDEERIRLRLGGENVDTPCDDIFFDGVSVFFSIKKEVGVYPLSLDDSEAQTITLFDNAEVLNIIVGEGAVEILSISDTEVSGRIDGRAGDENFVNGNFTVAFCPTQ